MIITSLIHGLGNQLFQYAIGRNLAHKHNTELKLDLTWYNTGKTSISCYRLDKFNIIENFATNEESRSKKPIIEWKIKNSDEVFNAPDDSLLFGYWQNEKYFVEIRDILLREFTLKKPLEKKSSSWEEKILSEDCAVSLHVRLGDYLHPANRNTGWGRLLPLDYYDNCIAEIKKSLESFTLFIFSDDIEWCKENLKFDVPTKFVEGCEHAYEELYLMSICKHNIIGNSSFAWWGAWLNQNPEKKVLIPSFYNQMTNSIKITVDSTKKTLVELPPMLSFIVYVENNLSTINVALMSLLSQDVKDYEIILIDASTDGSGKICRQLANDNKVNLLTVSRFTSKLVAWNKGFEMASGDYVLFLTAKDFLFPYVLKHFIYLYNFDFDLVLKNHDYPNAYEKYINISEYTPNIICSTQSIEEDENGASVINGIPNKKFSVKVDPSFQNLNGTAELSIPANQKLIALGTKGIDSSISTKFFKRKFLNENKIRFNENAGDNSELSFLVNAFMATEKITFVSQVFLGRLKG